MRIEVRGLDDRHEEVISEIMGKIAAEMKDVFPQCKACGWRFAFPKGSETRGNTISVRVFVSGQVAAIRKSTKKAIKGAIMRGLRQTFKERNVAHKIVGVHL